MRYADAMRDLEIRKARYEFREAEHPRADDGQFTDAEASAQRERVRRASNAKAVESPKPAANPKPLPGWKKPVPVAPPTQQDIDAFRRLFDLPDETAAKVHRPHPLPGWGPGNVPKNKPIIPAGGFQTEMGSIYEVNGESTRRNKAARSDHPGEEGWQSPSDKTLFVNHEHSQGIISHINAGKTAGHQTQVRPNGDKTHAVFSGPHGEIQVPYQKYPELGKVPIEFWKNGGIHVGHKIVAMNATTSRPDVLDDVHKALLSLGHKPREAKAKLKELKDSGKEFKTVESALEHLYTKQRNQESERAFYAAWEEGKHPRGQPENAGEFAKSPGGKKASATTSPKPAATKKSVPRQEPTAKTKSEIAKAAHYMVDSKIQRYAEEHNEKRFAKRIGGRSLDDNEPVDIVLPGLGPREHGIELKTMVENKNNKITMKRSAMEAKAAWERKHKAKIHTVVLDDSAVFNAKGEGEHDESKRRIFYRRGYGSFRVGTMYEVKGGMTELKQLLTTDRRKLPKGAA